MPGHLLDSGVVSQIRVAGGRPQEWVGHPDVAVAEVVVLEVMVDLPPEDIKHRGNLELFARLPADPITASDQVIELAEQLQTTYAAHRPALAPNDALIAATALVHDRVLVTKNRRDFHFVEGLRWIDSNGFEPGAGALVDVRAPVTAAPGWSECCTELRKHRAE